MSKATKRPGRAKAGTSKRKLRGGTNDPPVEPIPVKAETNGHAGTISEAVDIVVEKMHELAGTDKADPPDSPDRLAKWDRETLKLINRSERECSELKADFEDKAEKAKDAKKRYESATADHWDMVRKRRDGRGKPVQQELFDKTAGHAAAEEDKREPSEVPAVQDDSWKSVPLTELVEKDGLPATVAQLLGDAGINTMGELAAYTEPKPGSGWTAKLTDIKGIGPGKSEKIDEATAAFWTRWKPHATHTDATASSPAGAGGDARTEAGAGGSPGDRAAGSDQREHADHPEAAPAGYQTEGVKRIAKRKRTNQEK